VDGDRDDLALLVASAQYEIEALRADSRLRDIPGTRGTALRTHVLDLFDAVEFRMGRPPSPTAAAWAPRFFADGLRQGIHLLRGAHAALPWLEATREPQINVGGLYLAEEFGHILVDKDIDLVVVPNQEFMYSTTSWPFAPVIAHTRGFTPTTQRRPVVLNYPLSDRDRLLLHPLFAHEWATQPPRHEI